jgi:hypothetical protein
MAARGALVALGVALFLALPFAVEHIAPPLTPDTLPPEPLYSAVIGVVAYLDRWLSALTPANLLLFRTAMGYIHTVEIYSVTKLGIADVLQKASGPVSSADLATAVTGGACASVPAGSAAGCDAVALRLTRLLRATSTYGVFREVPAGGEAWAHTAQSRYLCADAPNSLRAVALNFGDVQFRMMAELPESITSGDASFKRVHGDEFWSWYGKHAESHAIFDATMAQLGRLGGADVAVALDAPWGRLVDVVVDVGGGHGEQTAAILGAHPHLQSGVVFDIPPVVERARAAAPATTPLTWVAGDMFDPSTLPGPHAEAIRLAAVSSAPVCVASVRLSYGYAMRDILHDWADEDCVRILASLRAAMRGPGSVDTDGACYGPDGRRMESTGGNGTFSPDRVLVIGRVVVPGASFVSSLGTADADMVMLGAFGTTAGERTTAHYASLFARAGLALVRVHPTRSHYAVLEARPI